MPKTPHKSTTTTSTPTKHNHSAASASAVTSIAAAPSSSSASASLARRHSRLVTTARSSVSMEKDNAAPTSVSTSASASMAASTAIKPKAVVKGYVMPPTKDKDKERPKDPNNPTPWKHPAELPYICRDDWSQDLIIEYLCQKSFSVPAKEHSSAVQLIQVTPYRTSSSVSSSSSTAAGSIIKDGVLLPRAYRVPLMFVAKFQWESLRLVLTSSNPKEEWEEYKFDIVHISRLCQHLFEQAREAAKKALAVNPSGISIIGSNRSGSVGKGVKGGSSLLELGVSAGPGAGPGASALGMKRVHTAVEGVFDKTWRSPMFDRVLTRFYRKWFVSREWSLKNFYEEFDEEEYEIDVLKYDWARWAIKGHKGFILTKEEVQGGITAEQYMRGLGKTKEGVWTWVTPSLMPSISPPMAIASNTSSSAVNGSGASGGVSTTNANANAISTTVASASQVLAQAEQAGNAPSAPITPTIPTSTIAGIPGSAVTNSTTSAETASGTGTEAASDAPPSFSTVQVKREHLENKVLRQEGAGAAKKEKKSKDGNGDRELSDEFAMITHPSHSDPQPPPPAVPASSASKQKTTTTTEPRPSTSTATSSTSSTPVTTLPEKVIGKKRPREEEPPIIAESVSAAPVQKQRRTIQTARKSMSVIHVQRSHREQMMRDKINAQISALRALGSKKAEKEDVSESASSDSSSPSSSSSEEDDERDEDYKVRTKPKTTGAGAGKTKRSPVAAAASASASVSAATGGTAQKRKSSMNGGSISANGTGKAKAGVNGSASTSGTDEREKKKARLSTATSVWKTPSAITLQEIFNRPLPSKTGTKRSSVKSAVAAAISAVSASTTASTSKPTATVAPAPAPKMMIASTEPVKTSSTSNVDSSSAAKSAKSTPAATTTTATATAIKAASSSASASASTSTSTPFRPTPPSTFPPGSSLEKYGNESQNTPPPRPRPRDENIGHVFSIIGIEQMGANLLGLNLALIGQGARDGTGPQGGAVEPPIPRDIVIAMGKMAKWMRAPPKNVLEIADPITKQTLRYLMGDLGLGPKIEKKKAEGEKVGEKGKGKEREGEKGKKAGNGKGKEKEKVVEAVKEKGKGMEGERRKEKEKGNVAVVQGDKETLEKVQGDDRVSGSKTVKAKEKESEKANDNAEGSGNVRAATPVPVIPRIPSDLPPTDEELAHWLEGTYRNGATPEKRKSPGLNSKSALVMGAFRPSNAVVSKKSDASATDTSTPSLDNQALATELSKASTSSPPSPSVASSMSISVSPAAPSFRRDTEDELASSSTIPLLPALSSSAEISSAVTASSPSVSRPSSPSPSPPSESVISPIILPPPIVTPTLVHPPISSHVPAPPFTYSPSSISVSTTVSPISSTTSPSLKEKAMSTILSVLPSIVVPVRKTSPVPDVISATLPTVVTSQIEVNEHAVLSPAEKSATPVALSRQVTPALLTSNGAGSPDQPVVEKEVTKTAAASVLNGVVSGHISDAQAVAKLNGMMESSGARDMPTTVEQMVQEDLSGFKAFDGMPVGTLEPPPKAPAVVASGDDQMDVDAAVVNGTESCPTSQTPTAKSPSGLQPPINATSVENGQPEQPGGLLMADGTRAKSMHTILLLRDLLQFLRIPGWDAPPRQGGDSPGVQKGDGTSASLVDPRVYYALLEGEETMNVEQRVDILAHASIALAKALFPFRGSESQLGTRINALDSRLHEQFEMLLKPEEREKAMQVVKEALKGLEKENENESDVIMAQEKLSEDKEVQTLEVEKKEVLSAELAIQTEAEEVPEPIVPVVEMGPPLQDLGVQTDGPEEGRKDEQEERKFDNTAIQTEHQDVWQPPQEIPTPISPDPDTVMRWAPAQPQRQPSQLTPDATMVDLTASGHAPEVPLSLPNDISQMLAPADIDRTKPAAKAMMSIMRNIADLIEYSAQDDSPTTPTTTSAKGKGRDVDISTAVQRYSGSLVVDAIVSEFRALKEELRISQQKTHEELDAIRALRRSGTEPLENEVRSKAKNQVGDESAHNEVEELKRRHQEEVEQLHETIRKMEKDKERARDALEEGRIPALELLELRRRISSLESRSRLDAETPGGPTPGPPVNASPTPTHISEPSTTQQRHTSYHPLGHLLTHDLDEARSLASPVSGRPYVREASTNPGTPLSSGNSFSYRHTDGMDVEDAIPLPIKSQRKAHMMMFPRPPIG